MYMCVCVHPREYISKHVYVYQRVGFTLQHVLLVTVLQSCINFVASKKIIICTRIAKLLYLCELLWNIIRNRKRQSAKILQNVEDKGD